MYHFRVYHNIIIFDCLTLIFCDHTIVSNHVKVFLNFIIFVFLNSVITAREWCCPVAERRQVRRKTSGNIMLPGVFRWICWRFLIGWHSFFSNCTISEFPNYILSLFYVLLLSLFLIFYFSSHLVFITSFLSCRILKFTVLC